MMIEDFVFNLTLKYKVKEKEAKDKERNKLFTSDLYLFCEQCPEDKLQDVYTYITRTHNYSTPFNMKLIYDFAEENDFIGKMKFNHKQVVWWWECEKCKLNYSSKARSCPVCGITKARVITDTFLAQDVLEVQEDCPVCKVYSQKDDDRSHVFGPDCGQYGRGLQNFDYCKDCNCKACCSLSYSAYRNKDDFDWRIRNKKLHMPWIEDGIKTAPVKSVKELAEKKRL